MNALRSLSGALGIVCLVIGVVAGISGGTVQQVQALGDTLILAGAILIAGVLISSAIVGTNRKG